MVGVRDGEDGEGEGAEEEGEEVSSLSLVLLRERQQQHDADMFFVCVDWLVVSVCYHRTMVSSFVHTLVCLYFPQTSCQHHQLSPYHDKNPLFGN